MHQCNVLDGYSSFLLAVVDVVRSRRTAAEPELIEFSLMALCALKRPLLVNDLLHAAFCIHVIRTSVPARHGPVLLVLPV